MAFYLMATIPHLKDEIIQRLLYHLGDAYASEIDILREADCSRDSNIVPEISIERSAK